MELNIGIIGFGVVTQGFTEILREQNDWVEQSLGVKVKIIAIKDFQKGNIYNPNGIDIDLVLSKVNNKETIDDSSLDAETSLASLPNIDVIVEATYSDYKTGDPATSYIREALENDKHVITTNKGPLALKFNELTKLSKSKKLQFKYEGTVLSGTPVFQFVDTCLEGEKIQEIRGILNGTSNYILSRMMEGASFESSLDKAQQLGYAEADPTNDVKGYDARAKVAILANRVFGHDISLQEIPTIGIDEISDDTIKDIKKKGKTIKLVASLKKEGDKLSTKVQPEILSSDDSLSSINGVANAIEYQTSFLNTVTLIGPGAGKLETGFAVFSDLLAIVRKLKK